MIRQVDLRGRSTDRAGYRSLLPRAVIDVDSAIDVVRPICDDVRRDGHDAVVRYARELDGVAITSARVAAGATVEAFERLDHDVRGALEESVRRLRIACQAAHPVDVTTEIVPGGTVAERNVPVGRVGVYVPSAKAPLISSVLMNVVPAQVAGVDSIALASPGLVDHAGSPHPSILAAAALLGIDEVYVAGGAVAFAMFAYGYDAGDLGRCVPVDLVTGPANVYGVAAKRLLRSVVGVDSEAGPTEIAILADDTARAEFVAADLVSQAEHDSAAASLLVTPSVELADAVASELGRIVPAAKHSERIAAALSGRQSAIVLVDDLAHGEQVVDAYAAEHLEIHTADAAEIAGRARNAGVVFVGDHSPVSLGDYCAGSNHVLPTGGCACHASGLSVRTFLRTVEVVTYSWAALAATAPAVLALSGAEDLPAHGDAVRVRLTGP